jgi:uncharacterized integral membrane protein (TIGR00697 family)
VAVRTFVSNELIITVTTFITFACIRFCFNQGRRWLQASVVINLILISVFGAKLIHVFGLTTNVGNVFYAMVFFAAQLLVEHFGKEEGRRSVWLGLSAVGFFIFIGQLTVLYAGIPEASAATDAISMLFHFAPRLATASLVAYLFAQSLNIELYSYLRNLGWSIGTRSLTATAAGQFVDSVLFFSIAFGGTVSADVLFQSMSAGFIIKLSIGLLSVPFLYTTHISRSKKEILEEEAEAVISSIGDGIIITDEEGRIITVNKACEEMLGIAESELAGKLMVDAIKRYDESDNPIANEERTITKALEGQKVVTSMTRHAYFKRRDGSRFPVRIVVTPVIIDRAMMGAVEVFQDVSEEKKIDNMRKDFLSLASHQLRTPLAGMRWMIETLRKEIFGTMNQKQRKYLSNLYTINIQMIQMVTDMLNVLHIESGTIRVSKQWFPVVSVCKEVVSVMEPAAKERNVKIQVHVSDTALIDINSDVTLVKTILESLVSNAVNYSRARGKVVLDAHEHGEEVVISVQDNGIGIPEDEQKRIFERFYRASNAKHFRVDGTGLGLYIASVLAEKIGARLSFESSPGKGSTFYLHIQKR